MNTLTHSGAFSEPIFVCLRRVRTSASAITTAMRMPSSRVELLKPVFGPHSGRKPPPMKVKPSGTGIVFALPMSWFRPRKMSMPARVTMNAGTPT